MLYINTHIHTQASDGIRDAMDTEAVRDISNALGLIFQVWFFGLFRGCISHFPGSDFPIFAAKFYHALLYQAASGGVCNIHVHIVHPPSCQTLPVLVEDF